SPSRLRTVTDRNGQVTTYAYDGTSQRITTITDARGHVAISQTYDSNGRVVTQQDARQLGTSEQTSFAYTSSANTTTTTITLPPTSYEPSWSPTIADTYDDQGRIITRLSKPTSNSGDNVLTSFTYGTNGLVSAITDGLGRTTQFCYDVDD